MKMIRIPQEHWGKVWRALVASGTISRVSEEPIYIVSDKQLRLLGRRKLPFKIVSEAKTDYFTAGPSYARPR